MTNGNEQITEGQIERALWLVTHKGLLKRIGLGLLIAFDALLLGYGIYGIADHFLIFWNRDLAVRRDLHRLNFSPELLRDLAPRSLVPVSVDIFSSGIDRYDLLAKLQNQNQDWYAEFKYQFVVADGETAEAKGFILPGEEKYVGQFAQNFSGLPRRAEFQLTDLSWRRVNQHSIRNYPTWQRERLNFILANTTHTGTLNLGQITGRTSFDIENRTAFGYWRTGLYVVLLRGTLPAAVNYITLDNFESGERRHVDVNWFEPLPATSGVDIRPEANIFDPDAYMPPRVQ